MNKHAYLIIAHNEEYILEKLIKLIDFSNNDIYLHLDKKMKNVNISKLKNICKYSNLYIIKSYDVKWSHFSQIKCELNLLKEATSNNKYSYYHLLSGVDLLLKTPKEIYDYFEKNNSVEYVDFQSIDKIDNFNLERIKYYHILNEYERSSSRIVRKLTMLIYNNCIKIQKLFHVNRIKNNNLEIRKGANWFSITDNLARYVISLEKDIKKLYKFTKCADEIFLQTIVYNSSFKENINNDIKRYIDWNRGNPYTYTIKDYNELINSNCFFARKFSTEVDKEIIDKIYEKVMGDKND